MLAIAVAPEGIVKEYILNAWDEIDRNYRINFISSNSASAVPHITLLAGIDEIFGDNLIGIIKKIAIDSTPFGMPSNGLGMLLGHLEKLGHPLHKTILIYNLGS